MLLNLKELSGSSVTMVAEKKGQKSRRNFFELLKTNIENMSEFGLSMIFMKTNELSRSFQDVDEKKGSYGRTVQAASGEQERL